VTDLAEVPDIADRRFRAISILIHPCSKSGHAVVDLHSATGLPPSGPPPRYLRPVASENRLGKIEKNGDKYGEWTYEADDEEQPPACRIMKILAAVIAVGLLAGLAASASAASASAASASAGSGPVTSVSFRVYAAPVTVSGGPGIVVTSVWSHGVLTISAD
jgi:hypothetical protein